MVESEIVLLNILASYVPSFIKRRLAQDPTSLTQPKMETFSGAVLFADITGFSSLAERLAKNSVAGAEELSYLLNIYIEEVIDLITFHGGDIVKFAGDALVALWAAGTTDDDLPTITHRAAQCGLLIQAMLHDQQPIEGVKLSLRVGVGAGEVVAAHVGGALNRWEVLIAGDPLVQMGKAEKQAQPGQVIISPEAWALIGDECDGEILPSGAAHIEDVHAPLGYHINPNLTMPSEAEAALRNYIPGAILSRLTAKQTDWLAELRRITVLFISLPDLDHTTPIEYVQQVMHALQASLYRYEGSINKLSADDKGASLVAALGLPPMSHEDDAKRSVQAALSMQAALRALGVKGAIGISTGETFCGVVGSQKRREYTMIGDVVNLAARLMQAAPQYASGDIPILCDEATYYSARTDLSFKILPPIQVKGRRELVPIYCPLQQKRRSIYPQTRPQDQATLIGREAEQHLLKQAIANLRKTGNGQVIVFEGEAGIGKSRLLEELFYMGQEAGLTCLIGAGDPIEQKTPFHVWRTIFNQLFGLEGIADLTLQQDYLLAIIAQLLSPSEQSLAPLLTNILPLKLPDNDQTTVLSGQVRIDHTRYLLMKLLQKAFTQQGQQANQAHAQAEQGININQNGRNSDNVKPVLLILEDAQWLDRTSWHLMLEIAAHTESLLLVLALRPMEEQFAQQTAYDDLLTLEQTHHIHLDVLSLDDSITLVQQRLNVKTLPDPVTKLIREKAEGHPFFSEELAYSLRDMGLIHIEDGQCQLTSQADNLESLDFPHTIRGVITSRIDRLTPEQQLMLKVASVIGRIFPYNILHDIHPVARDKTYLADYLRVLEKLDITPLETPEPNLAYIFKHISTQEVAYDLMLFSQRRQLHQAVAEWYEANHADNLDKYYPLLAHHWSKAVGDHPTDTPLGLAKPKVINTAIDYLVKAGEQASDSNAHQEASEFFNRALNLLNIFPETPARMARELKLLVALGNALIATKGFAALEVHQTYSRAQTLCEKLEDAPETFFVLHGMLGLHFVQGDLKRAYRLAQNLLNLAQKLADPFLILKAEYSLGHTEMMRGQFKQALDHLDNAFSLYEPGAYRVKQAEYHYQGIDPGVGARAYSALTLWFLGYPDQAKIRIKEALQLAQTLVSPISLALAIGFEAMLAQLCREVQRVQSQATTLIQLSEEHNLTFWQAWGQIFQAWALATQAAQNGETNKALATTNTRILKGLSAYRATGAALYCPYFLALLAELYGQTGQTTEGLRLVDELLRNVEANDEHLYKAEVLRIKGDLLLQHQNFVEAARYFDQAHQTAIAQGSLSLELRAATSTSRLKYLTR